MDVPQRVHICKLLLFVFLFVLSVNKIEQYKAEATE